MNIEMSEARGTRFSAWLFTLAVGAAVPLAGCVGNLPQARSAAPGDDAAITAHVRAAMTRDPLLEVSDIDVRTYQGIVQLSGFVASADSVGAAASVARSVKGVRSVRNDLRLK